MENHSHCHAHGQDINDENAKKTLCVILITLLTMIAEIVFGHLSNSMALLSDGWHMGTHALALSVTFIAFIMIKKFENSDIFPSGTGKISPFAGFISALFLAATGIFVLIESTMRFFNPLEIGFNTAILVAIIGLIVNGACLLVMQSKNSENDYNYKAAYLHILTDALTSVFAIVALLAGKYFGLYFLDPVMGLLGGYLILRWSVCLIKETSIILLDIKKRGYSHPDEHNHCFSH